MEKNSKHNYTLWWASYEQTPLSAFILRMHSVRGDNKSCLTVNFIVNFRHPSLTERIAQQPRGAAACGAGGTSRGKERGATSGPALPGIHSKALPAGEAAWEWESEASANLRRNWTVLPAPGTWLYLKLTAWKLILFWVTGAYLHCASIQSFRWHAVPIEEVFHPSLRDMLFHPPFSLPVILALWIFFLKVILCIYNLLYFVFFTSFCFFFFSPVRRKFPFEFEEQGWKTSEDRKHTSLGNLGFCLGVLMEGKLLSSCCVLTLTGNWAPHRRLLTHPQWDVGKNLKGKSEKEMWAKIKPV